jgi:hypothetical protein
MKKAVSITPPQVNISFRVDVAIPEHVLSRSIINVTELTSGGELKNGPPPPRGARESLFRRYYLRKYLPSEIQSIAHQMLVMEWIVFQAYRAGQDAGAKMRPLVIARLLRETERRLRKRIFTHGDGRPKAEFGLLFLHEKIEFAEKCFICFEALSGQKKKMTKTNLATELFPKGDSLRKLNASLQRFKMTFQEVIGSFTGYGPEQVSTVHDMLAQMERSDQFEFFPGE